MNQEIKDKLKQAAETAWEQDQKTNPTPVNPHAYVYGYKAGAQTILDNPIEWGLRPIDKQETWSVTITQLATKVSEQHSQLTKYREALEKIAEYDFDTRRVSPHTIAKEALKQQ